MMRTLVRRATLAGAALTVALLLTACGDHGSMPGMEHGGGTTAAGSASPGSASPGSAAFNDADVMFAQMMIPHHRQAVQMAALADTRAADAEVKTLAAQIKAAQDPEIQTMTGWLSSLGKPAPAMSGMSHGMPGMMSDADMTKLEAATGKDFDKQFCTMMIAHHRGAVTMAQDELKHGANPDAKALAQRIITAQQAEIDTMNTILARL